MRGVSRLLLVSIIVLPVAAGADAGASLDHGKRVDAHRAVERVLWERRIWPESNPGPKPPLEAVLPESALRARVDEVLRKSNALAEVWKRPVGSRELQAELDRMARGSRDPGMLRDMLDAVGRDPVLAAEVIARPVLVDRLIRSWYASDSRYHETERLDAERALASASTADDLARVASRWEDATFVLAESGGGIAPSSTGAIPLDGERWGELVADLGGRFQSRGSSPAEILAAVPVGRVSGLRESESAFTAAVVLSKSPERVRIGIASWPKTTFDAWWPGERGKHAAIAPDLDGTIVLPEAPASPPLCTDNTWNPVGSGPPGGRAFHTMVWTGSEMLVWGGWTSEGPAADTGARYDPATDTWSAIGTNGDPPSARGEHVAVWTGTRMIVWGGRENTTFTFLDTGSSYDPIFDYWIGITTTGAPSPRIPGFAVWTGTRMVVWGDRFAPLGTPGTGGRYDPVANTWSPTSTIDPAVESGAGGVWTGSRVVVWPGKRYDPVADVWTPIATAGAPAPRTSHSLVWTGSRVLVWGGVATPGGSPLNTGAQYDPVSDTWSTMTTVGAPEGRLGHASAWVLGKLVVWGGEGSGSILFRTGGRYDPLANVWAPTTTTGAPPGRQVSPAIATASEMIVWGGFEGPSGPARTGGRYDPVSDSWVPTRSDAPAALPRAGHATVWTGTEMIVWSGYFWNLAREDGGAYTPATDSWSPLEEAGAPEGRANPTAVWTGTAMIVWGGGLYEALFNDGGMYSPTSHSWSPVSTAGAPAIRWVHTAVWTGTSMIVWGGASDATGPLGSGGRYDPVTNSWSPTSLVGAPEARGLHRAVWTGTRMVVWGGGGFSSQWLDTGGRYDPVTDSWTPTATAGAPTRRNSHTAVWTGSRMLVWGGIGELEPYWLATGGSYDPALDGWSPLSTTGAPSPRADAGSIWTGAEMIVWGGDGPSTPAALADGGRYRPENDSWHGMSATGAPAGRFQHGQIWTGARMLVWGGGDNYSRTYDDGATYCACVPWYSDADGDGYGELAISASTCDGSRPPGMIARSGDCNDLNPAIHPGVGDASCNGADEDCDFVFDEDYLTQPSVCGLGVCRSFGFLECVSGGITNTCVPGMPNSEYDDTCNALDDDCSGAVDEDFQQRDDYWTATAAAPSARTNHTAVFTGVEMIVFGGDNGSGTVQTGGAAYAPATNAWRTLASGPLKRWHHTAVWTGTRMIVWGGDDNTATIYNSGSRYDPASDTWATTTTTGAPTARGLHSAVWTGSRMVIWGGRDVVTTYNTGSRYDPAANTWAATTTTGAASARTMHGAVWTGTEMIVWGGLSSTNVAINTGGRYNPTTNTWSAVTTTGAPSARYGHVAVWTGTEMIVWGGTTDGVTYLTGGARYNPATNTWAPINSLGAPGRRAFASAVWTGQEVVIWGGTFRTNETPDTPLSDGARYNPAGDFWSAPTNAHLVLPAARARAAAVWTGNEMIVWGGDPNGGALSSGGRYNPRTLCGVGGCQQVGLTYCSGGTIGFACTPLPPTAEVCDGLDNDCDVAVDEGIPIPTGRPAVLGTKIAGANASYAWIATPDTTGYDVVRGVLGTLRSSAGNFTASVDACLANDLRGASIADSALPAPGNGSWYLVRPMNQCSGSGSYDEAIPPQQGSRDAEIAAAASACP